MNPAKRHAIFETLRENNPTPTTELEYTTPFELLIAVLLSAQATDVGVNKATRKLFPVANTPAKLLALGEEASPNTSRPSGYIGPSASTSCRRAASCSTNTAVKCRVTAPRSKSCRAWAARPPTW